jgi:hypothetical protein
MSATLADVAYWAAAGAWAVAAVPLVVAVVRRDAPVSRVAATVTFALAAAGLVSLGVSVALEWSPAGLLGPALEALRLQLAAAASVGAYLLAAWRSRDLAPAGLLVLPVATASLAIAGPPESAAASAAIASGGLRMLLLAVSISAYAACTLLGGAGLADLLDRASNARTGWAARLAAAAFVVGAASLALAAAASYRLTGSLWAAAAGEAWMLFTVLGLALYMHSRLTLAWGARALAAIALVVALGAALSLWQVRLPDDTLLVEEDPTPRATAPAKESRPAEMTEASLEVSA